MFSIIAFVVVQGDAAERSCGDRVGLDHFYCWGILGWRRWCRWCSRRRGGGTRMDGGCSVQLALEWATGSL